MIMQQQQQHTQPQLGVGKWTRDEHQRYLQAIKLYPQGPWQSVANYVGTRSARQTQTHAQKYREKVSRRKRGLLRKRALSDEWLEAQAADSEKKYDSTDKGHPYPPTLPTLSTIASDPTTPLPLKNIYSPDSHTIPPPRLPVLEPIHGGTFHLAPPVVETNKPMYQYPLPNGGFVHTSHQSSYPSTSSHNYASTSYSNQEYHQATPPPSHHHHLHHSAPPASHYRLAPMQPDPNPPHRAPPLEELLQFFVDDVELSAHPRHTYKSN
ncbi:hypothetical protein AeMF1_012519 [Aphanomyces euteiches]|nr:hypothetical protein AeMF1_012519 [Aphanomyces euteiches]